ncbi:hypothetical protein OHT57_24605 [Streptomyces sp. NBC_00285]|uniref:hypothetical protein n=1 Tax=Streptomyces sp. NBC_00285 TaxID=2975700 RepID=UPI002E2D1614|nr:hypothetical protein [Streptomyces sp. NBC_00285]
MIRNRRKAFLVSAAFLGSTLLMTACDPSSNAADKAGTASATATTNKSDAKGVSDTSTPAADSDSGSTPGSGTSGGGSTPGSGESVTGGTSKGKSVTGTWYGIVRYVAPGKYLVDGPAAKGSGGEQQIFWLAEDTVILGGGQICGTAGSKVDAPCEEADLEKAAKKGVEAEVQLKDGIATQITDGALIR